MNTGDKKSKKIDSIKLLTVSELRIQLKKYPITGIYKMNKSELVSQLTKAIKKEWQRRPVHPLDKYTIVELRNMVSKLGLKMSDLKKLSKYDLVRFVASQNINIASNTMKKVKPCLPTKAGVPKVRYGSLCRVCPKGESWKPKTSTCSPVRSR
jgi:hypothetical protein